MVDDTDPGLVGATGSLGNNITAVADNGTLAFNLSGNLSVGNLVSGTGGVAQLGSGTTTLTVANTFTGGVTLGAGQLQLGNAAAHNSNAPNAIVFSANSTGALVLNGNSVTVSSLSSNASVGSPSVQSDTGWRQ